MIQQFFPFRTISESQGTSERLLEQQSHLSRGCIRDILSNKTSISLLSLEKLSLSLNCEVTVLAKYRNGKSEMSVVATAIQIERDGFDSWKIHLMNFVDEFRHSLDPGLILLPPPEKSNSKIFSLLASVTSYLCSELKMQKPNWANKSYFLTEPWFVSEMESLKAMAILESPLEFRKNNIFVLNNFLQRA